MPPPREPFELGGASVAPGERRLIELPISALSNGLAAGLRVMVIHGRKPGPTMFVSAAVHGDEILGVEIIRRLIDRPAMSKLQGTLIVVPIVNAYGFLDRSRYLPDRRDLNRSFPGSREGSLAARLAHTFMSEVVSRCELGIDLHTAAIHRENLPQLRINASDERAKELAEAFGPPVILASSLRDGSLRQCAAESGVTVLLFEAGEALRFDETAVRAGLAGILRVMTAAGMVRSKRIASPSNKPFFSRGSEWVRAPAGGLSRLYKKLGDPVSTGDRLGAVSDPFGTYEREVLAPCSGVVVGRSNLPVVNEGDALLHIAHTSKLERAADRVDSLVEQLDSEDMFYEDEII